MCPAALVQSGGLLALMGPRIEPSLDDLVGAGENRWRDRGTAIQKKAGRPVQFEITEETRASIRD
jgi:hypothetical protein